MTAARNPSGRIGVTAARVLLLEGTSCQPSGLYELLSSRGCLIELVELAQRRAPPLRDLDEFDLVVLESAGFEVDCSELLKGASGLRSPEVVVVGDPGIAGLPEALGNRPFHLVKNSNEQEQLVSVIETAFQLRRLRLENHALRARLEDAEERKAAHRLADFQAHHDLVTRLPNRTLLNDRLDLAIAQAQRNDRKLALMFLDLDGFKAVNDSQGHELGDRLLRAVAERLQGCVRRSDTLARFGGDEFALLLPDVSAREDAAVIAGKLLGQLEEPFVIGGRRLSVGASVGIAIYPENGDLREVLIRKADIAMYHVKGRGKNAYRFYEEDMGPEHPGQRVTERELHAALVRGEVEVHYLPRVNLESGRITSLEAQWRWRHPEFGLVEPAELVPVLESVGYRAEVDDFLQKQAFRQTAEWRRGKNVPLRLVVNVPAGRFGQPGFVERFSGDLLAAGLDMTAVAVQIDEVAVMQGAETMGSEFQDLVDRGIRVFAREFGAGFLSLRYLDRFEIAGLNLSSTLLRDLRLPKLAVGSNLPEGTPTSKGTPTSEGTPTTQSLDGTPTRNPPIRNPGSGVRMIAAITAAAREFGLDLAAAGVETTEQLRFLKSHGIGEADGPVFSPALPAEAIYELIRKQPFASLVRV